MLPETEIILEIVILGLIVSILATTWVVQLLTINTIKTLKHNQPNTNSIVDNKHTDTDYEFPPEYNNYTDTYPPTNHKNHKRQSHYKPEHSSPYDFYDLEDTEDYDLDSGYIYENIKPKPHITTKKRKQDEFCELP